MRLNLVEVMNVSHKFKKEIFKFISKKSSLKMKFYLN